MLTFNFPIFNKSQNWEDTQKLHQIQSWLRPGQKPKRTRANGLWYWHVYVSSQAHFLSQLCFKTSNKFSYLLDLHFHQISFHSYSADSLLLADKQGTWPCWAFHGLCLHLCSSKQPRSSLHADFVPNSCPQKAYYMWKQTKTWTLYVLCPRVNI